MEWGAWDEGSDTVEILYTVWRNQSTNQARNQARNRVGNVCSYPYTREIRSVNSVHIRILSVNSEISREMIRNHSLISKSYFRALCRTPRHETYLYLNFLLLSPFIFLLLPIASHFILLQRNHAFLFPSHMHKWMQSLQWSLQAALSGSEVLKVEVYDHETVGSNRYVYYIKPHSNFQ